MHAHDDHPERYAVAASVAEETAPALRKRQHAHAPEASEDLPERAAARRHSEEESAVVRQIKVVEREVRSLAAFLRLAHDSYLDAEAEKRQHRGEKLALLRKLVARDAPHADRHRDERGHAAAPVMDASASPVPAAAFPVALPPAQPQWRAYPAPPYAIAPPLAAMPPPPSPMVTYGQCPAVAHFGYAYPSQ